MIALKYTLFAVIATGFNLAAQALAFALYSGVGAFYCGLLFGTLVGLVVKYLLDKHYIFYSVSSSKAEQGKEFFLYSLVGVFTTGFFWLSEIGFDYFLNNDNGNEHARYIGGALGLAVGYFVKYQLDKRYVFSQQSLAQ